MAEPNIVNFPKGRRRKSAETGDEKLVGDIRSAWRRLRRTIDVAQRAGLRVEFETEPFNPWRDPTITRRL